jgi:hypothetical protein
MVICRTLKNLEADSGTRQDDAFGRHGVVERCRESRRRFRDSRS